MPSMRKKELAFTWKRDTPPAVEALYYWQQGGTSFSCKIFELLGKADAENRAKLSCSWPELCSAYDHWHAAPSSDAFFAQYQNVIPSLG